MDNKNGLRTEQMVEYGREDDNLVVISAKQLMKAIRRKLNLIIAAAVLGAVIGFISANPFGGTLYEVSAGVLYQEEEASSIDHLPAGVSPLSEQIRRSRAYAGIFKEHKVLDAVIEELAEKGIETDYDELSKSLTAGASSSMPMVKLKLSGRNEEELLITMDCLLAHKEDVMFGAHTEGEAIIYNAPSTEEFNNTILILQTMLKYAAVAAAAALVILLLAEIFRLVTDKTVRSEKELANLIRRPVLAVVPTCAASKAQKETEAQSGGLALISANSTPQYLEAFKMMRTNLTNRLERHGETDGLSGKGKVIMITSSLPGEGKSNTGANLAAVMASDSCKLLLIDSNFANRTLTNVFAAGTEKGGLQDVLSGKAKSSDVILHLQDRGFDLMPAGAESVNPADAPDCRKMKPLFDELRGEYDIILVDAAAVNTSADPSEIGKLCDECIIVVSHDHVSNENVVACRAQLKNSSVSIIGTVLNMYDPMKDSTDSITKYYS